MDINIDLAYLSLIWTLLIKSLIVFGLGEILVYLSDKFVYRNIDFQGEIQKGNKAVATIVAAMRIGIYIMLAIMMK